MLYEHRTYTLTPGGLREYLALYNEHGRAVQQEILGNLVSLLQPETGDLNQLHFLWAFDSYEDRRQRRSLLMADARFTAFRKMVRHLLIRQENQLLQAA